MLYHPDSLEMQPVRVCSAAGHGRSTTPQPAQMHWQSCKAQDQYGVQHLHPAGTSSLTPLLQQCRMCGGLHLGLLGLFVHLDDTDGAKVVSQVLLCGLRTQAADVDTVCVRRLQAQAE